MHMIGHQTIGPNVHLSQRAPLRQQRQIRTIIRFTEKSRQPAFAALGYMVRPGRYNSRYTCHGMSISKTARVRNI